MSGRRRRAPAGRLVATLTAVLAAWLVAACTATPGTGSSGPPPPAVPEEARPAPTGPAAGEARQPPGAAGFVRTCQSSVHGELEGGWRRRSVVVGPLAFAYLREVAGWPAGGFRRRGGGYPSQKVLVVVENGATATVTVPPAERRHVALLYDPSGWKDSGGYRVADGRPAVTFRACRAGEHPFGADDTQFNGGFVVAGPRCATLEVTTSTSPTPRRVTVSFGAGRCRR